MYVISKEWLKHNELAFLIGEYGFKADLDDDELPIAMFVYDDIHSNTSLVVYFDNVLEVDGFLYESESCMEMLYRLIKDNVIEYVKPKKQDSEVK